jgi:hypothetical protein
MTDIQFSEQRHPAFLAVAERRSATLQLRVADAITALRRVDEIRVPARRALRRVDACV